MAIPDTQPQVMSRATIGATATKPALTADGGVIEKHVAMPSGKQAVPDCTCEVCGSPIKGEAMLCANCINKLSTGKSLVTNPEQSGSNKVDDALIRKGLKVELTVAHSGKSECLACGSRRVRPMTRREAKNFIGGIHFLRWCRPRKCLNCGHEYEVLPGLMGCRVRMCLATFGALFWLMAFVAGVVGIYTHPGGSGLAHSLKQWQAWGVMGLGGALTIHSVVVFHLNFRRLQALKAYKTGGS